MNCNVFFLKIKEKCGTKIVFLFQIDSVFMYCIAFCTGAQDDLKKVTKMAYDQIRCYGMSDIVGVLSFPDGTVETAFTKPYSKRFQATIDEVK